MEELDVVELIYKSLQGELTVEERQKLHVWLVADENNQLLFDKICDREQILQKAVFFDRHDSEKAWKQIHQHISGRRKSISFWYKCAAAILLPLLVGGFFYISRQINLGKAEQVMADLNSICPGQSSAVIKLADGRVLDLQQVERDSSENGISFINADGVLHYRAQQQKTDSKNVRYNEVFTPRGGEYSIILSDGTKVWLNSESSLRFPIVFESGHRTVYVKGELYFEVAPDKSKPFLVISDQSVIEVVGTQFNVRAYADRPYATTLISGKVNLKYMGGEVHLHPGQQAVLYGGSKNFRISDVDVSAFIAWKEGRFLFDDTALEDIMYELGRWYNVDVCFVNETMRKEHFSVDLKRHENFEKVLKLIEQTGMVKLEVKDRVVIVK